MGAAISVFLRLNATRFGNGLRAAQGYGQAFGQSVGSYFKNLLSPMNAALFVIKSIIAAFERMVTLARLQAVTNIPAGQLRALGMAAQKAGIEVDEGIGIIKELHQAMLEANSQGARAILFENLGISVEGLKDGSETAITAMSKIIAYTEKMGNSTQTAYDLMRALGPELAQKMMPFIQMGSGKFNSFVNDKDIQKLNDAAENAWRIQQRFEGIKQGVEKIAMRAVVYVMFVVDILMSIVGKIAMVFQGLITAIVSLLGAAYALATGDTKTAGVLAKNAFTKDTWTGKDTAFGDFNDWTNSNLVDDMEAMGFGGGQKKNIPKRNIALESQLFIPTIVQGAADKLQAVGGGGNMFSPGVNALDVAKQTLSVNQQQLDALRAIEASVGSNPEIVSR